MSRKARQDKSLWKTPSVFAFVGEYGPLKLKRFDPIDDVIVVLQKSIEKKHHAMFPLASSMQEIMLRRNLEDAGRQDVNGLSPFVPTSASNNGGAKARVLVIDVGTMFESDDDYKEALEKEDSQVDLSKKFGKTLWRLFQRLLLRRARLIARDELCSVALKLVTTQERMNSDEDMISQVLLVNPQLSKTFVNNHLVVSPSGGKCPKIIVPLNLLVGPSSGNKPRQSSRVDMLRYLFPQGETITFVSEEEASSSSLSWLLWPGAASDSDNFTYDPDYCNNAGKTLFLSQITVEMDRHTKQYERHCEDVTALLMETTEEESLGDSDKENVSINDVDWSTCEMRIGALVLRGNRCVLVRSLKQGGRSPKGMFLPSVVPTNDETPTQAAIRAVVEHTEVDSKEVQPLPPQVLPVSVYYPPHRHHPGQSRPIWMQLYPLYATEPPPDGPLEDADMEDDETLYDWYTFPNAMRKLEDTRDTVTQAALQTMALNLVQAANVGLVPSKYGGTFGQEFVSGDGGGSERIGLGVQLQEWNSSISPVTAQDSSSLSMEVAKAIKDKSSKSGHRSLPVTLISGFLGSGKTTLLSHILGNYDGLKVAILVNDMGAVNIDAALVKKNVSIRQREEHLVELSNGCICCTLREDLLVEVSRIAADPAEFDYLLIESTGVSEPMPVAETFTFEDSAGLRLGDVAHLDTLVTVVDGSRFLSELESLQSLRTRNWHADADDERTISHLLCDQVEFANVIVLNKCDLLPSTEEKIKVKRLIQNMNPTAKVVESVYSSVSIDTVLGTGLFSMSDAERHEGWLQEARVGEHTPETEEYGIGSFTYRARKPFYPHKLKAVLDDIVGKSSVGDNVTKATILRAKGFIWLANCPQLQGDFSLAGSHYSLLPGNPWWAEIDRTDWPENLERAIAPLWHEVYGDRQQELVIIGQSLDEAAIAQELNACLVPDHEMTLGQEEWTRVCHQAGDPFQTEWETARELFLSSD